MAPRSPNRLELDTAGSTVGRTGATRETGRPGCGWRRSFRWRLLLRAPGGRQAGVGRTLTGIVCARPTPALRESPFRSRLFSVWPMPTASVQPARSPSGPLTPAALPPDTPAPAPPSFGSSPSPTRSPPRSAPPPRSRRGSSSSFYVQVHIMQSVFSSAFAFKHDQIHSEV